MRRVHTIVWGVLLAFGAFVIHESLDHNYYGSDFGPGPGFFSFWLGILLMVLSLVQIVMTYRRPGEPLPDGFIPNREGVKRMLSIMGALVASLLVMKTLGFSLTMMVFCVFLLRMLGPSILVADPDPRRLASFGTVYLFGLLQVTLPKGILGHLCKGGERVEAFQHLMTGFVTAMSPMNLLFATIGCILGTLIGVLPGLGPAAGTALLIPITFKLDPTSAIIMLAAIYYGAMYGGTITSVLINVPGEAASVVTCLDGYEMAKQGRAGAALGVAAIGSFIGGTVATFGLVLVALPLARFALKFGPPEYFSLLLVGLSLVMGLAGKSLAKALVMGIIGLIFSFVGVDPVEGAPRFTFGIAPLMDGIRFVPVVMGFFGIGEILINAEKSLTGVMAGGGKVSSFFPRRERMVDLVYVDSPRDGAGILSGFDSGDELGRCLLHVLRHREEDLSHPEKFGTGVIEGVAAPETANNAYANAALIPLFTLGLPGSPTIAILMGALIMNGLTPGPLLFSQHAGFVWAVIASLYIGNRHPADPESAARRLVGEAA